MAQQLTIFDEQKNIAQDKKAKRIRFLRDAIHQLEDENDTYRKDIESNEKSLETANWETRKDIEYDNTCLKADIIRNDKVIADYKKELAVLLNEIKQKATKQMPNKSRRQR